MTAVSTYFYLLMEYNAIEGAEFGIENIELNLLAAEPAACS